MAAVLTIEEFSYFRMSDRVTETLLSAFRQLMRPLVRILLRHGISYGEYADTAKTVFVEVARKDFQIPGKKQTQSRVAIITGLTRKDVGRINDLLDNNETPSTANLNRVGRVLAGWHQDPVFTGPYGLPLELDFDQGDENFTDLVRKFSGDMPARAMLEELKRVNAVKILAGEKIRALTRSYIPVQVDTAHIQFMGVAIRDLAETLDLNLNSEIEGGNFERRVWTPTGISPRDVAQFDLLVREKGQEFLESLDNWLTSKETESEDIPDNVKVKVGVGVYYFSDEFRSFRED